MNTLILDLRYAMRMLMKSLGFMAIAVLTLALGIGANTALFSVVNGVLLNPLPYRDSNQLVAVYGDAPGFEKSPISYPNFVDWQRQNEVFSSMALYRHEDYNLTGNGEGQRVTGYMVTADFFRTLSVTPVLGRTFRPDDDVLGGAPVVVLGGGLWQRRFGSAPDIIGKTMTLNGVSYTVIGVIPSQFSFYGNTWDVYVPLGQWNDPSFRDRRISVSARVIARMKPGVTVAQAKANMQAVARNLAAAYPQADKDLGVTLLSMKEDIVGKIEPLLLVLLGAVGFLLLIACANVANLLLARSTARSHEFATRVALGASQARILRQVLTESVLLAAVGGALGVALAVVGTKAVIRALPGALPRATEVAIDVRVLLFSALLCICAGIIFGLTPAFRMSRINLNEVIKEGGRTSSAAQHRLQGFFITGEVAMALVLLIGAGLMLRSIAALWRVNPGFNPSHAITFNLFLPATATTPSEETRARLRQFDEKLQSIPGVEAISVTLGSRPMIHDSSLPFWIVGQPKPANDNEMPQAMFYLAEAGFQQAMGITLQRGRFITAQDDEHAPVVIDIDDVFARTYFPGQDPIGKRIFLTQFNVEAQIVGVVNHIRQWGLDNDPKGALEAQFYYAFMQLPEKLMPLVAKGVAVVLRTKGDPTAVVEPVRQAVAEIDARQGIYAVQTMTDVVSSSFAARRLTMILLGAFAALALALACVGIYGVISYLVGRRTREIGVRMALGAQRSDILQMVLNEGTRMAAAGAALGLIAAFALMRLMASQLFGVSAHDPVTFIGLALVLMLVAIVACYIPARRATRVDPMIALRYE
jgi:putative ABC transport system permease protein